MDLIKVRALVVGLLKEDLTASQRKTLEVILAGIDAFVQKGLTAGEKAQELADRLLPLIVAAVPSVGPYMTAILLFEQHLGDAVDWLADNLAPIKVTDKQQGPVVHDDGKPAPLV